MTTLPLGTHVDASDPIAEARARGVDCVQIFIGEPQKWKGHEVAYPGGPQALREAAAEAGVGIYVHAPYIINVAAINNRVRIPSRKLLQTQIDLAAEIDARGLIVHGGHAGGELDAGYDNWRKAIDGLDMKVPVLIENTAGGDTAVARGIDHLADLWPAVLAAEGGADVGLCLDTCHAWASGEDLPGLAAKVRGITGRIDLIHANDSRDLQGSRADRHANFGAGSIPEADLQAILREAHAPIILETPGGVEDHLADLAWARAALAEIR